MKSWLSRWIFSGGDAMAAVGLGRFAYVFPTKGKQMLSKAADLGEFTQFTPWSRRCPDLGTESLKSRMAMT